MQNSMFRRDVGPCITNFLMKDLSLKRLILLMSCQVLCFCLLLTALPTLLTLVLEIP